ncbi:hypothetical protein, partial [Burkholderia sp. E168m23]|uniref:hypothetical protein n=1 Tax=Burkholderia sp. E168m23 TaxID=1561200 RepID=UPI001F48F192
ARRLEQRRAGRAGGGRRETPQGDGGRALSAVRCKNDGGRRACRRRRRARACPGGVAFSVSVNRRATVRGSARFIDAM